MLLGDLTLIIDKGNYCQAAVYLADMLKDGHTELVWVYDPVLQPQLDSWCAQLRQRHSFDLKRCHFFSLPEISEKTKSIEQAQLLWEYFAELQLSRSDLVIAFGGGIVGDLVGFAVSTYLRGLRFIQCPSTFLAMIDAAYGGKTACNTAQGKNQLGSFYPAESLILCPQLLRTLPVAELRSGLAEWIKYACLSTDLRVDYEEYGGFTSYAEQLFLALTNDPTQDFLLNEIIKSLQIKYSFVSNDLYDKGRRQYLNFGHSFAHALEVAGNYCRYTHGEAVALGILCAVRVSLELLELADDDKSYLEFVLEELSCCYRTLGLSETSELCLEELIPYLYSDKKRCAGKLSFICLKGPAQPCLKELRIHELSQFAVTRLSDMFDTVLLYPQLTKDVSEQKITLPPSYSKSLLNRTLIISAIAQIQQGKTEYRLPAGIDEAMLYAEDIQYCYRAVHQLLAAHSLAEKSCAIDCGGSATIARFLIPIACQLGLTLKLEGNAALCSRSLKDLRQIIDFSVQTQDDELYLPISLEGREQLRCSIQGNRRVFLLRPCISSQHISGLLCASVLYEGISELSFEKQLCLLPSWSYIELTLMVLAHYGVRYELHETSIILYGSALIEPQRELIAPDESQDIYWTAYAALHKRQLSVKTCSPIQLRYKQADFPAHGYLQEMCADTSSAHELVIPLDNMPDAFPILAITAACSSRSAGVVFTQLARLKHKESDRLQAILEIFDRCSVSYEYHVTADTLRVYPGVWHGETPCCIDSKADHRIAMAASLLVRHIPVRILQASCVKKSFPQFFYYLEALHIKAR